MTEDRDHLGVVVVDSPATLARRPPPVTDEPYRSRIGRPSELETEASNGDLDDRVIELVADGVGTSRCVDWPG